MAAEVSEALREAARLDGLGERRIAARTILRLFFCRPLTNWDEPRQCRGGMRVGRAAAIFVLASVFGFAIAGRQRKGEGA
jgi:hypothetical protein